MSKAAEPQLDGKAIFYMFLLAVQFGIQPVLTRTFTPPGITRSTVILVQEVLKFAIAFTMMQLSGATRDAVKGESKSIENVRILGWGNVFVVSLSYISHFELLLSLLD
jgi:thiamine transporter ThiT